MLGTFATNKDRAEHVWQLARQPLSAFMLDLLPLAVLAELRRVCQATKRLADEDTVVQWQAAAGQVINHPSLAAAENALAVQHILQRQGQMAGRLLSGMVFQEHSSVARAR